MDSKTLQAYAEKAKTYSEDWLAQPEPLDVYDLLKKYFVNQGQTADIGCGNGHDSNWLSQNTFTVTGFDASEELIHIARKIYPHLTFEKAHLPELRSIQNTYQNILCETVIMHLTKEQITEAIKNLKRILHKDDGVLYLSWRVTLGSDSRHEDGRLYSAFEPDFIMTQFDSKNILHFEDKMSESSRKRVCRLIYKNTRS